MKMKFKEHVYKRTVDSMELSTRTRNALHRAKIETIEDIIDNFDKLHNIKNMGKKCQSELKTELFNIWLEDTVANHTKMEVCVNE